MGFWDDMIDITHSKLDSHELMAHQQEAVNAMNAYYDLTDEYGKSQNGLVVMPIGSGKTFTAVNWLLNSGLANGYKIVWLVHRQDLVTQIYKDFKNQAPCLSKYGIEKLKIIPVSGVHYSMSQASRYDVNICGINSIANNYGYRFIRRMLGVTGMKKVIVVIDEAHHAVSPSYKKVIQRITDLNPNRILLGLTSTPIQMQERDHISLMKIFNVDKKGYIYEEKLKNLLINGSLAQPIYKRIDTQIVGDIEYLLTQEEEAYFNQFGDIAKSIKTKIALTTVRNKIIVKEYLENEDQYGKTLVFAVNQLHCRTLYKEFKDAGISCDYIISDKDNSQQTISDFKHNKFKVLINYQIFTEGNDVPDIQTIFLTRQTNSDSLLMQMIGRGLRGIKYGGTKEAYIVDFHDTWEKFSFWLDPKYLPIFSLYGKESKEAIKTTDKEIEIIDAKTDKNPEPDLYDIYLRIYNNIRKNITGKTSSGIFPQGWYSVLNDDGNDYKVLVFDHQSEGYKTLEKNISKYLKEETDPTLVISECFDIQDNLPEDKEFSLILEMIYKNKEMPNYYSFKQRGLIDPREIFKEMKNNVDKPEREEWLKTLYYSTPILQELYKVFYIFKKTVLNAEKEKIESEIHTIDERKEFNIAQDYYNLDELLDDVISDYKFLNRENLLGIRWTNKIILPVFGLCQKYIDEAGNATYNILINKLLSSPNVPSDVVKYVISHEMLHKSGFSSEDDRFNDQEWQYPNADELDGFLDKLGIRYNIPTVFENKTDHPSKKDTGHKEEVIPSHKFCRNCGNKLPIETKFCDKCGDKTDY